MTLIRHISWRQSAACFIMVALTAGKALATTSNEPPASWPSRFAEAGRFYDEGHFLESAQEYEKLLAEGWVAPEIYFNLGNAQFKASRISDAILNYRRAWYLAPRDPDIRANLQYALQTAGAPPPDMYRHETILMQLPQRVWARMAVVSWWLLCFLIILGTWYARYRIWIWRIAGLAFASLLISGAGLWAWHELAVRPEYVIVSHRADARFAPLDNAVVHFVLPQGAIAREIEREGNWTKIRADGKEGWVSNSALTAIYRQGDMPALW